MSGWFGSLPTAPAICGRCCAPTVAGSWVLVALTLANFSSPEAIAAGQFRFVAEGQDPNDVARYLDLGFPLAALLLNCEPRWPLAAAGAGLSAAGPGGRVAHRFARRLYGGVVALVGSGILLGRAHGRKVLAGTMALLRPSRCCGSLFRAEALRGWLRSASSFRAAI